MEQLKIFKAWIEGRLGELHRGQGGAVAIMVLAALLIVFMISLVIYDTGKIAKDKMEVQAAADVATWSQSAVEARSMNTVAFANVGKKIIVGMNAFYESLIINYIAIFVAAIALAIVCAFFCQPLVEPALKVAGAAAKIFASEASDIGKFFGSIKTYFKDDAKAFDKYQKYIADLTPWWSWGEGYIRGARNGAAAVSGWPVPKAPLTGFSLPNLPGMSPANLKDILPVKKQSGKNYHKICSHVYNDLDILFHFADYELKSLIQNKNVLSPYGLAVTALAGAMSLGIAYVTCHGTTPLRLGEDPMPYEISMGSLSGAAGWQMVTSNLAFAYRPDGKRNAADGDRQKYKFMQQDYQLGALSTINLGFKAGGVWAMARSEISYQKEGTSEAPTLWYPSWTSRMRPLSVGTEWKSWGGTSGGKNINGALIDALPYMVVGTTLSSAFNGFQNINLQSSLTDVARMVMATGAMNNERIQGSAR